MPHYGLILQFLTAKNTAAPSTAQARTIPSAIRTFSPALCPGALEGAGQREAVAVRAGVTVSPALGVAVGVTTVGLGVTAAVLLDRGVGVGVGAGVGYKNRLVFCPPQYLTRHICSNKFLERHRLVAFFRLVYIVCRINKNFFVSSQGYTVTMHL